MLLPADGRACCVCRQRGLQGKKSCDSEQPGCLPSCCPCANDSTARPHVQVTTGKEKKSGGKRKWSCFILFLLLPSCVPSEKGRGTCLTGKKQLKLFPVFTNFSRKERQEIFGWISYRPDQGICAVQGPAALGGLLGQVPAFSLVPGISKAHPPA